MVIFKKKSKFIIKIKIFNFIMSCLFNSLSHHIPNLDSTTIRNMICDYLQNNNPIIEDLSTNIILELEDPFYVKKMRGFSTWGGAIEIQAACNIWSMRIIVVNKRDSVLNRYNIGHVINNNEIEFIPISKNINRTVYLEWTGGHYEPI